MRYANAMQRSTPFWLTPFRHMLVFTSLLLVLWAPTPKAQDNAIDVIAEPVTLARENVRVIAVGRASALRSATLRTDASGFIDRVNIQPNQLVERGDVLLTLDSREQRLALALAEVRRTEAERLLDRYERTIGSGSVAPTTIDAARRDAELAALEVQNAQVALDKRTLTAPFNGHTGLSEVEPGERVAEDTVVTTLDARERLRIRFQVSERFHDGIEVGDRVQLSPWSRPQTQLTATIERRASRIDIDTGTIAFDARLDNQADHFRPGMSFRVSLSLPGERLPRVPETAVQWGDDGAYVWVIENARAQRVGIDLSARQDNAVLVRGDIQPGALVVREGVQQLRNDARVRVISQ